MSYVAGYGSDATVFTATVASTDNNNALLAAGTKCVLDGVLVDGTSDATDVHITVETVGGTKLVTFSGNLTGSANLRTGFLCGPYGIRSSDGLQFDITNNAGGTPTVALTFLHRVVGP